MRRAISHTLWAAASVTLVGCASAPAAATADTALTRTGEAVQVTQNAAAARDCEYVAELPTRSAPSDDSLRALRNEAGDLGANLVLLVMESRTTISRAEGYLCAD